MGWHRDVAATMGRQLMLYLDGEPTLEQIFSDPVIHAIMTRDRVDLDRLRRFLREMSATLGAPAVAESWRAVLAPSRAPSDE